MKRPLALLLLLVVAAPAAAQAPEPIKLTLSPAAAPEPALKYLLLPDLAEQKPGNAALLYYRAFNPEWMYNLRRREVTDKVAKAIGTPAAELKDSDLRWLLDSSALREVDRAARREYCDWEVAQRLREQGIALQVPEIRAMREFGMFLSARARLEMAQGQLDRALYSLRTGYALARHVGDGPTLMQALVGSGLGSAMTVQLEELLRQPGAPNLYWALSDLPRPFTDLRKALQGEKIWLVATFPELRDVETAQLSAGQAKRLQAVAEKIVADRFESQWKADTGKRLAALVRVAKGYPEAKRALIASGRKPAEVEAMPAVQVVVLRSLEEYYRLRDEAFKWMALPYPEARVGLGRVQKALDESAARDEVLPLTRLVMPALVKVYSATTLLDRRIAALRCVEALRLYAAAHDGRWPATLADVTDVPIPTDPMTGKGFEYKVNGDTATLTAGPLPDAIATASNTLIYELTLRK